MHLISFILLTVASLLPSTVVTVGTLFIAILAIAISIVQPHRPAAKLAALSKLLEESEERLHDFQADDLLPERSFVVAMELSLNR